MQLMDNSATVGAITGSAEKAARAIARLADAHVSHQNALARANGTLLMSTTGGARWAPLLTYQHGCHSYSQIVQFQDGKLGIVFDDGGDFPPGYNAASGECKGITSNQTYVLVELT